MLAGAQGRPQARPELAGARSPRSAERRRSPPSAPRRCFNFLRTGRGDNSDAETCCVSRSRPASVSPASTVVSLSGCDMVSDWLGKSKTPLPGERVPVFAERSELEPDRRRQPACWPCRRRRRSTISGRSPAASPTMRCTPAVSASAADHLDGRCRGGLELLGILTSPPVVAEGKVFAKDAQGHRLGLQCRHRPAGVAGDAEAREGARWR